MKSKDGGNSTHLVTPLVSFVVMTLHDRVDATLLDVKLGYYSDSQVQKESGSLNPPPFFGSSSHRIPLLGLSKHRQDNPFMMNGA